MTDQPADTGRMPAIYLGHGAPPLLEDAVWMAELGGWAAGLPRPKRDPDRQRPLADRADGDQRDRRRCRSSTTSTASRSTTTR